MSKQSLKVFGIARVSTLKQEEGESHETQEKLIREYAKNKGLILEGDVIKFDEPASRIDRPKFELIIKNIEKQCNNYILIFSNIGRFSRKVTNLDTAKLIQKCEAGHVEMHFVRENLVINSNSKKLDITRLENDIISNSYTTSVSSQNLTECFDKMFNEGYTNSYLPQGYLGSGKKACIDEERVPFVLKMFEMFADGAEMQEICDTVNDMGFRCKPKKVRGSLSKVKVADKLTVKTLAGILKNPFYIGILIRKRDGKEVKHKYGTFIPEELFYIVQKRLNNKGKKKVRMPRKTIFSGKVKCKNCPRTISCDVKKEKHIYLRCGNKICKDIREDLTQKDALNYIYPYIEKASAFLRQLNNSIVKEVKEFADRLVNLKYDMQLQQLRNLNKELSKNKAMRDEYIRLLARKLINEEQLDSYLKLADAERVQIEQSIKDIVIEQNRTSIDENFIKTIGDNGVELWAVANDKEKRKIIDILFSDIFKDGKTLDCVLKAPLNKLLGQI